MNKTINPTLEDVAREARVSTATISRAINEPHKVARTTLVRVEEVIDRLGYTPNYGGRVLASNRSDTIGAVIPTMANSMFAGGLQAFQEVLAGAGKRLLVASAGYDPENELREVRALVAHGADALLLIGSTRPAQTREFLSLRNIPCVISWSYQTDTDFLYSGFDNHEAAADMTRQVLAFGHRRIAMIAGHTGINDRAASRVSGVRAEIENFGGDAALVAIEETDYSLDAGGLAFESILAARERPSAIVCGNDVLAAGAILRARSLGIDVPGDVSITGFDDIDLASATYPALTTVRVPQTQMGRTAAALLLRRLNGDNEVKSVKFDTEVILRKSLAPL